MPEKSLQVTRLRLVTWKDFSGICDLEKSILTLPLHWIDIPVKSKVPKLGKTASVRPLQAIMKSLPMCW